jgi:hypothetical protein
MLAQRKHSMNLSDVCAFCGGWMGIIMQRELNIIFPGI